MKWCNTNCGNVKPSLIRASVRALLLKRLLMITAKVHGDGATDSAYHSTPPEHQRLFRCSRPHLNNAGGFVSRIGWNSVLQVSDLFTSLTYLLIWLASLNINKHLIVSELLIKITFLIIKKKHHNIMSHVLCKNELLFLLICIIYSIGIWVLNCMKWRNWLFEWLKMSSPLSLWVSSINPSIRPAT